MDTMMTTMTDGRFDELQARFGGRRQYTRAAEALRVICAWCPGFDPTAADNAGASHTMCPACVAKAMAELDHVAATQVKS